MVHRQDNDRRRRACYRAGRGNRCTHHDTTAEDDLLIVLQDLYVTLAAANTDGAAKAVPRR